MNDLSDLETKARDQLTRMITNIDPDADVAPAAPPTRRLGAVVAAATLVAAAVAGVVVVQSADGDSGADDVAVGSGRSAVQDDGTGAALAYTVSLEDGTPTLSGTASAAVVTVEVAYTATPADGDSTDAPSGDATAATTAGAGADRSFTVELPADAVSSRTEVQIVGLDEDGTEIGRQDDVLRFLISEDSGDSLTRCALSDVDEVTHSCEAG